MAQHVYDWKHGWIPITPTAARQKNHGRAVKSGSWVAKLPGATGGGKAERGPKVGESAAGKGLHVGDVVHVHSGPHAGKEGVVVSAAGKGRVLVGKPGTSGQGFFAQNAHVAHAGDHAASKKADAFIRTGSSKSSTDHVKAAAAAVKAGDHATAINHLTAAMGKTTGAERAALKAHRDKLARKVMHGTGNATSDHRAVADAARAFSPAAADLITEAHQLTKQGRAKAADNRITKAYNTVARAVGNETNRKKRKQGEALLNRIRALR